MRISIAPMMDVTDRHFRYFIRLLHPDVVLYTEMITVGAILFGDRQRFLDYHDVEHPIVLQIGGSDVQQLASACEIVNDWAYDEINLNVGCPSDRVQAGKFGACLMKEPQLVADCIASMQQTSRVPVTVKTRIGVDDLDSFDHFMHFIDTVASTGCNRFIIHARKAWLKGLSPKENRDVPPLHYDWVLKLKTLRPELAIEINGGINQLADMSEFSELDGVMIGRLAWHNPYCLADLPHDLRPTKMLTRIEAFQHYLPYAMQQLQEGVPFSKIARPLFGLFQGVPGAKAWRRLLSDKQKGDGTKRLQLAKAMIAA